MIAYLRFLQTRDPDRRRIWKEKAAPITPVSVQVYSSTVTDSGSSWWSTPRPPATTCCSPITIALCCSSTQRSRSRGRGLLLTSCSRTAPCSSARCAAARTGAPRRSSCPPGPERQHASGTEAAIVRAVEGRAKAELATLKETPRDRLTQLTLGDPRSTIYVRPVRREVNGRQFLYLDYWWYLPDNPARAGKGAFCGAGLVIPGVSCFDHQSDWEGITVKLDTTEVPGQPQRRGTTDRRQLRAAQEGRPVPVAKPARVRQERQAPGSGARRAPGERRRAPAGLRRARHPLVVSDAASTSRGLRLRGRRHHPRGRVQRKTAMARNVTDECGGGSSCLTPRPQPASAEPSPHCGVLSGVRGARPTAFSSSIAMRPRRHPHPVSRVADKRPWACHGRARCLRRSTSPSHRCGDLWAWSARRAAALGHGPPAGNSGSPTPKSIPS